MAQHTDAAAGQNGQLRFALALTGLFLALCAPVALHHEMWLDELQAWLIARDSASFPELLHNLRYEGHPPLWHLLLWPLTRLTPDPAAMQALHLCLAAATVFVFAWRAPFGRGIKALFAFGYFPFYEYAVMARNYAPGVLLLFLFCALWRRRTERLGSIALVLLLMCMTNALTFLLALTLLCVLVAENLSPGLRSGPPASRLRPALACAFVLSGAAAAALQTIPPADSGYGVGWIWKLQANSLRRIFTEAFVPIPALQPQFWGTTIWGGNLLSPLFSLLGLSLCGLLALRLLRKPSALAVFLGCELALLTFFDIKHLGAQRHHGHMFMAFLAAAWLGEESPELPILPRLPTFGPRAARAWAVLLPLLLALNVAGAGVAAWYDLRLPFSKAQAAAAFLREQGLDRLPLAASPDLVAVPVLGYLGKDRVWYLDREAFGSFILWDETRNKLQPREEILRRARAFAAREGSDVVLLTDTKMVLGGPGQEDFQFLAAFTGGGIVREDCQLYLLRRPPSAP